jgi:2-polyprenyl-3-methyl-5-hydroxy-6-metoxy-1,4-benzoquinol methylase
MAIRASHRLALKLFPEAVVMFLARAHRPLARYLAGLMFRRRHGQRPITKIYAEDDLLHWARRDVQDAESFRYFRTLESYFEGGEGNVAALEQILSEAGHGLAQADAVLEFACGAGRLTRHLVRRMDRAKLTVSDIDRGAVDFVRKTFGVDGFYSESEPEKLAHDRRYDVIIVVSLFSHLPSHSWKRWLRRLEEMLSAGGLLVFSTLTWNVDNDTVPDYQRDAFELGLLYSERNETRGRLGGTDYGTTYTRKDFVSKAVSENHSGTLIGYFPGALNGVQDVYVVRRPLEPQPVLQPE